MQQQPEPPGLMFEYQLLMAWLDDADVGLCVVDDTSRVVSINQGCARLLHVDALAVINMPVSKLLVHLRSDSERGVWLDALGRAGETVVDCVAGGPPTRLQVKTRIVAAPSGDRYKVLAVTDITAALDQQAQLEQSKRQWSALNAGVVVSDATLPDMPIVYVNPMFERMSGYAADEIMGRNCRFLQADDCQQPAIENIRFAIKNQINGQALLRNYRKDGSLFLNELFVAPVKDAAGRVTHYVGVQHPRSGAVNRQVQG